MTKATDLWTDPNQGLELPKRTLVWDRKRQQIVLWIKGVVVPPIGTEIELSDPDSRDLEKNITVTVVGVRMAATTVAGVTITLDVEVPDPPPAWYEAMFKRPS